MLGYELYQKWAALNPAKQRYAMGWFTAALGMEFEGHTIPHTNSAAAKHGLAMLEESIIAAIKDKKTDATPTPPRWTKDLPTEPGAYWWWCGDRDSAPIHIEIMTSGHGKNSTYFAPMGQYGWTQPQAVNDMGGWWMTLQMPEQPEAELSYGKKD